MGAMKDMVEVTVPVKLDGTVTFHMPRGEGLDRSENDLQRHASGQVRKVMMAFERRGGFRTMDGTLFATVTEEGSAGVYDPMLEG